MYNNKEDSSHSRKRSNTTVFNKDEPSSKSSHIEVEKRSKGCFDEVFDKDIRPYIDIIDSMRNYGLQQDISLPNVVVVGDQSSGKSSIIEVISGIQLPRGAGMVTRCPLELQLKKVSNLPWRSIVTYKKKSGGVEKWETNNHDDVGDYIMKVQEELCLIKNCVSKSLITLRVESPEENAPDLTLIDLPGIVRIPTGDQPADICDQIKEIINEYIQNKNTVILCVISGNLDVAVNESIKIAKLVDPDGLRTIGVITKPDLSDLDQKKEIMETLDNKKINLKKGFNLVKCRSLEQLKKKLPLSKFMENEMEFYEKDEIFKKAKKTQLGAVNLSKKISVELVNVIKITLPSLRVQIEDLLTETNRRLSELPKDIPQDNKDKRSYIMDIATDLNDKMGNFLIRGEINDSRNYYQEWRNKFNDFQIALNLKRKNAINNEFTIAKLAKSIEKYRGNEICGFLSFGCFERLMKPYIQTYKSDAINVITSMTKILKPNLEELFEMSFAHLSFINKEMKKILCTQFEEIIKITEEKIDFIFKQEDIIFTMDSIMDKRWKKSTKKISLAPTQPIYSSNQSGPIFLVNKANVVEPTPLSSLRTATSPKEMLQHISCYLKIVHTRLIDNVSTAIMQCLLIELHDKLKTRLFEFLSNDDIIGKIVENSDIFTERKELMDKIQRLKRGKIELHSL